MAQKMKKQCKCCGSDILVRVADHNRGWGNFCNKSCKAKLQEKKNGQHAAYLAGRGVSNLHPERLRGIMTGQRCDAYTRSITGKVRDPFDEDGYLWEDYCGIGEGHGQWE